MIGALVGTVPLDAPVTPSPDEAESLLRRELLRPEYHDQNLLEQFWQWLGRQLESGLDRASSVNPVGALGAIVLFCLVLVLLGWLVSRTRPTAQATRPGGAVLTEERTTAAQLRERALDAIAAGDAAAAVVEGFRALTLRQIELGVLDDQPGATAREVARGLAARSTDRREQIDRAASLFDLVLYGYRPADLDQARAVLALDEDLAPVR